MSDNATPAKVRLTDGLGLEPERATMRLTLADLGVLAATAERNGTQHAFQAVALQWCGQAQAEIERLRMDLENTRAEPVEPVQEPVAWEGWWLHHGQHNYRAKPLTSERVKELMKLAFEVGQEAAPPQRKPLSEEEIMQCFDEAVADYVDVSDAEMVDFARAIERAHGIGGEE